MIVESHRNEESGSTIEEIDNLMQVIDRQASESKAEKKVAKVLLGKDKFRSDKLWSEENL